MSIFIPGSCSPPRFVGAGPLISQYLLAGHMNSPFL